jgi:hypothetical protein
MVVMNIEVMLYCAVYVYSPINKNATVRRIYALRIYFIYKHNMASYSLVKDPR